MADSFATRIARELGSWDGVVAAPHRFGGLEFRVGRRELGHLHGSRLADLPFPVAIRNQLVAAGRAEHHHILPDSGWVSVRIRGDDDVRVVVELFRLNYDRPWLADPRRPRLKSPALIVVRTFSSAADAGIAKGVLDEAGIDSMIRSDNAGGMYPALAGADLLVREEDAKRALEALEPIPPPPS